MDVGTEAALRAELGAVLPEILSSLLSERPVRETMDLIVRHVARLAGFESCVVALPDAGGGHVHVAGAHAFPEEYAEQLDQAFARRHDDDAIARAPTIRAFEGGRTVVVSDIMEDDTIRRWRHLARRYGYRSLVSVPLRVSGQVIGVLNGYSANRRQYSAAELDIVETLAGQAAVAIRLAAWHEVVAERAIMTEQAPVGICRLDLEGRVATANPALAEMWGCSADSLRGRSLLELVHPEDRDGALDRLREVRESEMDRLPFELRVRREDGSVVWCSVTAGLLRAPDGHVTGSVGMVEDVTERRQQAERAMRIQRDLWPQVVPELEGYELAGACRPAEQVAGDLYDWRLTPDGQLDLTLADVMGKGIGAALVMATLRASLRSAPVSLGPAERLRLASEVVALGGDEEGLFVTVFQARLEPATGELRYVDAGHGYCAVRSASGALARLPVRSLPVGVKKDEKFREGSLRLQPGEMLLVHSDGLVELGDQPVNLGAYASELDQAVSADDAVSRLLGRMQARPADDVTVIALRRLPGEHGPVRCDGAPGDEMGA